MKKGKFTKLGEGYLLIVNIGIGTASWTSFLFYKTKEEVKREASNMGDYARILGILKVNDYERWTD